MELDRKELKRRALETRKSAKPSPVLVTLVYLVLTGGIYSVVRQFSGGPTDQEMIQAMQQSDPAALGQVLGSVSGIGVFLSILVTLYILVMQYGYADYSLRLSRGQEAGYGTLISGFAVAGKVLLLQILVVVLCFLWYLAFAIPATLITIGIAAGFSGLGSGLGITFLMGLLIAVVWIAAVVFMVMRMLYYSLALFTFLDDPEAGCRAAVRRSKELMRGRRGFFFVLLLSFIGWYLLCVVTVGILSLWVTPYVSVAEANFYDAVRAPQATAAQFRSPEPF